MTSKYFGYCFYLMVTIFERHLHKKILNIIINRSKEYLVEGENTNLNNFSIWFMFEIVLLIGVANCFSKLSKCKFFLKHIQINS